MCGRGGDGSKAGVRCTGADFCNGFESLFEAHRHLAAALWPRHASAEAKSLRCARPLSKAAVVPTLQSVSVAQPSAEEDSVWERCPIPCFREPFCESGNCGVSFHTTTSKPHSSFFLFLPRPPQVRYLKIIEKSGYQALPWVRYITQNGGKETHTHGHTHTHSPTQTRARTHEKREVLEVFVHPFSAVSLSLFPSLSLYFPLSHSVIA